MNNDEPLFDSDVDPKRIKSVADGLRRQGEFESARMLDGYADLLEAREKAVPIYQLMATDDSWWDVSRELYGAEGSHAGRTRILYTHPAPSDAERLAETLPSDDWFANEICEARNHWHEHHEANWLETDDNHPDDFMGKWLRSKLLAAHDTHPQPAQDASKYQELLMAVSKKFPNESRHETALRYIKQTELQSCEPKCDAAMAKESGR